MKNTNILVNGKTNSKNFANYIINDPINKRYYKNSHDI
jgi:hypothetical protein